MLRMELVQCPKCGKLFKKTKGGFVKGVDDDCNLCPACKTKSLLDIFKK